MTLLDEKLEQSTNFYQIFEVVKRAVEVTLGTHRAGLTLVLAELPTHIGAYHELGSNLIVIYRTILNAVSKKAESPLEVNSFIFYILAHEYLHSLGYTSEERVESLMRKISSDNFRHGQPVTKMSRKYFGDILYALSVDGSGEIERNFEVITDFDKSSIPYIW